jgi:hypothetical protein
MACGEGLAVAFAGAFGLGEGEGGAGGFEGLEGLVAALLLFDPESAHEVGYAFGEPGAWGAHDIQAWVRAWARTPSSWSGCGADGRGEQEPVSKGVLGVGQVEEGELGAGRWPSQPCRNGVTAAAASDQDWTAASSSGSTQRWCWRRGGGADGDEEAGGFEAEGFAAAVGGGDAGGGFRVVGRVGDGERGGMAVDEGDGGGGRGELDGEAEAEVGAGEAELVLADFVEEAGAVAEDDGDAGDGVPDDVAEAAQAGEVGADAVPVGVEGDVVGGADGGGAGR